MFPDQDPRQLPSSNSIYYESDSGSPITRQLYATEQLWPQTTTTANQGGHHQPHQSLNPVESLLEALNVEDMNYPLDFPDPSYPSLSSAPLQVPGPGTNATYTDNNISFVEWPFGTYPEFDYGPQLQDDYTRGPAYAPPAPPPTHIPDQHPLQDVYTPQTPQGHYVAYPYPSSTQLLSPTYGGPVYHTDARATHHPPDNLAPNEANTATGSVSAGRHSPPSPVVASSSNQILAPVPSRPHPKSPERKRLHPYSAAEHSPVRRIVPRRSREWSVHSTSSNSSRYSHNVSEVFGGGRPIPQEWYKTSTVSSYSAVIPFDLANPDQNGIPITDILNKTDVFARLRNRSEAFDMEKKTFTLRVLWPGYPSWSKTIAAMDWTKVRAPVTRVKLAEAVATAIHDLLKKYRDKPYDPDYARWNVGANGIRLDQICLVALHQVSKGSWQPELCLLNIQN